MTAHLLTPRDIAADTGLSVYTVTQYLRAGAIPGARMNGNGPWRTEPAAYQGWREQQFGRTADVNRIEPRSTRSRSALGRKAS